MPNQSGKRRSSFALEGKSESLGSGGMGESKREAEPRKLPHGFASLPLSRFMGSQRKESGIVTRTGISFSLFLFPSAVNKSSG